MALGRRNRLGHVGLPGAEGADRAEYYRLDGWVTICATIRFALERADIDPAGVPAMRLCAEAEADFALLGADPPPPTADPAAIAKAEQGAAVFWTKIDALARQYVDGSAPDFARASAAELYAWALLQGRR